MINIQNYPEALQFHMRYTATQALALGGIACEADIPAVEQLNKYGNEPTVLAAREAIILTMVTGEPVEARFTPQG